MAITLNGSSGIIGAINSGTAVASTSGTSIDFTGIPSGVKRITVMFNGVGTSGTSNLLIQIGSGSVDTTGYVSSSNQMTDAGTNNVNSDTTGFVLKVKSSSGNTPSGIFTLVTLGSNVWVSSGTFKTTTTQMSICAGNKTLSGTLDRVRITAANGSDTFNAGSINILYE